MRTAGQFLPFAWGSTWSLERLVRSDTCPMLN